MKDNHQTPAEAVPESQPAENTAVNSDIDTLQSITEKYELTTLEKKVISKIISLLETEQMQNVLPPQNIGDSVFKMYVSDGEPTEFLVDRVEFDESGWNLVSYEKFGTSEMEFVFNEKDYNHVFFDTADAAKEYYQKM